MPAEYLVRFDDICPTMNWKIWNQLEQFLIDASVRPILAVVPDNQDPVLQVDAADSMFWDKARAWQARGWTVALHGYQHLYVTNEAGIVGLNRYSEFAGLSKEIQEVKLRKAVQIFQNQGLRPEVWIAPAHSFDATTIRVLSTLGIHIISDGFALYPYRDRSGIHWIPQQLWRFHDVPFGVWTITSHFNEWTPEYFRRFRQDISHYRDRVTSLPDVLTKYGARRRSMLDDVTRFSIRVGLGAVNFRRRDIRNSGVLPQTDKVGSRAVALGKGNSH